MQAHTKYNVDAVFLTKSGTTIIHSAVMEVPNRQTAKRLLHDKAFNQGLTLTSYSITSQEFGDTDNEVGGVDIPVVTAPPVGNVVRRLPQLPPAHQPVPKVETLCTEGMAEAPCTYKITQGGPSDDNQTPA